MLCFGQRKYPFLPFVISLFTYAIFFTPAFHSQSTVPAFRDSPGPHGQLGLLIQLLQFCAHNKKHPRIADSTRESRILSATIREYCVTLSFCAQVAVSFDGYLFKIAFPFPNHSMRFPRAPPSRLRKEKDRAHQRPVLNRDLDYSSSSLRFLGKKFRPARPIPETAAVSAHSIPASPVSGAARPPRGISSSNSSSSSSS